MQRTQRVPRMSLSCASSTDHLEPVRDDVQHDQKREETPHRGILQGQHDQQHGSRHATNRQEQSGSQG